MPDDIKTDPPPAGSTERPGASEPAVAPKQPGERRSIGPESEVRGGSEADEDR